MRHSTTALFLFSLCLAPAAWADAPIQFRETIDRTDLDDVSCSFPIEVRLQMDVIGHETDEGFWLLEQGTLTFTHLGNGHVMLAHFSSTLSRDFAESTYVSTGVRARIEMDGIHNVAMVAGWLYTDFETVWVHLGRADADEPDFFCPAVEGTYVLN